MQSLSHLLNKIQDNGKKTFLSLENKIITYRELYSTVKKISGFFKNKSINAQDRLVIISNDDEVITLFSIAAFFNGITSVILSDDVKIDRASSIINKSKPSLIVIDEDKIDLLNNVSQIQCFRIKRQSKSSGLLAKFNRSFKGDWFDEFQENTSVMKPIYSENLDDIAFIFFTSGSTDQPKGVQLSYHNVISHLDTLGRQFNYSESSKILNNMMLPHSDGMLQGPILTLYFTASLYRPCSMALQNLELYLNTIHAESITHMITVPTILNFIDQFSAHDDYFCTQNFKVLASVAGDLDKTLWIRLEQRFGIRVSNIYGLTETVAGGLFCGPDDKTYRRGTIGKPIDMSLKIMDTEGNEVGNEKEGELYLKGSNVFVGYFDNEFATHQTIQNNWIKTGDIVVKDSQGFIHYKGRIKELIVSGGFNIHPSEVNEVLLKHESIIEASTVGLKDKDWGEIVVSAVVVAKNIELNESDIFSFCHLNLEAKKIPKRLLMLKELPRGISGKVKIKELQRLFLQSNDSTQETAKISLNGLFSIVSKELSIHVNDISLTSKAGELQGWDSIGHLKLMLAIEEMLNTNFNAQEIMSISSIKDIWELINLKQQ